MKITAFTLVVVCLFSTCDLTQTTSNVSTNKSAGETSTTSATTEQNTASNPNSGEDIKSPYQTKPRRKKIQFPDDCHYFPNSSDKNWQLQLACAEALDTIQSDLPEDDICEFDSYRNRLFYDVVEDSKILSYTVQATDNEGIEGIAKKLGTTKDVIIINSKLSDPNKLVPGQEIKYQKAHTEKYRSSWFSRYLEDYKAKFYPLSSNKYLVEVRCAMGAYNVQNVYLLYDESAIPAKAEVLEFPSLDFSVAEDSDEPTSIKESITKIVGGRWFNPKTKELIMFVKARGIGDAGKYARYSFPKDKPKLEEYRARFKWSGPEYTLDEILRHPPKTWKRYYPR